MRISKILSGTFVSVFFGLVFCAAASAAEDVSATDLQAAAGIIVPGGESLGSLEGYSSFHLSKKSSVTGGISVTYESYLSDDPWLTEELPHLQLLVFSYNSQDAAQQALASLAGGTGNGKTVLDQDARHLFYESDGGSDVDSFATIDAEYKSYHYLHTNGNLLFQASIYRTNGLLNEENLKTYTEAVEDAEGVKAILSDAVERTKAVLGALFPPTGADYVLNSESYSFDLNTFYSLPNHGTVSMEVYIGEPSGAVGTLLDSAGLGVAEDGDLYLYVNENGHLLAGIYAPDFDADCEQKSGWYQVESTESLSSYEWNEVALHFGVGGFGIEVNGEDSGTCSVSQPRVSGPLYLGDFSGDKLDESMIGYVNTVEADVSRTDSGQVWDQVLSDQLFLDLAVTDPDVRVFEFLKEAGVFLGSDGMLYPDQILNRAEMVKILLKAFEKDREVEGSLPFYDVPSDAWYGKYLLAAFDIGMIQGHEDGSFLPGHSINRAEFFTMLNRLKGSEYVDYGGEFLDVDEDDWFMPGAVYARSSGLLSDLLFYPAESLSRRDAAQYLYQVLK